MEVIVIVSAPTAYFQGNNEDKFTTKVAYIMCQLGTYMLHAYALFKIHKACCQGLTL